MVSKKYSVKLAFVLLIALVALGLTASLVLAQEGARVFARPVDAPDDTLVIDVMAENVADLYGAEFRLTYDPAVLSVQDFKPEQEGIQIEAGTLLPANKGFVVANQVNETEGTVTFAITLLNPAPPATGGGPLARVTFNILQDSPSSINIEHAKLVSVDLQTIASHTEAFAFGGDGQPAANQPAAPAGEEAPAGQEVPAVSAPAAPAETETAPAAAIEAEGFPWWIVAAVIMILGILALGGFLVMDGLKSTTAADDKKAGSLVDGQPIYRPGTFKNR